MVVPLFRSGDINSVNNYRSISLLPIISKILEKIVANQLLHYLKSKRLITNSQHGFRPKLSTETALTVITDKIYNMENKSILHLTLCDLSKAFHSVSHSILLSKCTHLNIDSFWFKDYVSNITQSDRLNNTVSSLQNIACGVSQGSAVGPILFNIYVNDIADYITDCLLVQYADDTQFLHTSTIDNLNLLIRNNESTLHKLKRYFLTNGLLLNPAKTQCIFIGSRQLLSLIPPDTISLVGDIIHPSTNVKNLGVYLDRYMTFDVHVNELNKKVVGILMHMYRISLNFEKRTLTIVVQSLVLSLVNYCIRIWGTINATLLNNVQKLKTSQPK